MSSFFKTFFMGILYIILLPFIALLLAIYFIYCVCMFLCMGVRCLIVFFAGGYPLGDLPEDVKAKEILAKQIENAYVRPQPNLQYQQNELYQQGEQYQPNNVQEGVPTNNFEEQSIANNENLPKDDNNDGGQSQ